MRGPLGTALQERRAHTKKGSKKGDTFYLQNFNRIASVTDMLRELEWDTLEMRRKKNRLTVMYKLSHSLVLKTSCRIARPEHI